MTVSIALCTYNGAAYLEQQIDSLLQQARLPDEVVCCDDGSTDNTVRILQRYAKAHPLLFRVIGNAQQLGPRKNFEKAVSLCSGDVIFLCDQDDIWHAGKIARTLDFFEKHPGALGVFCNGWLIDDRNASLHETMWDVLYFEPEIRKTIAPDNLLYYFLLNGNVASGTALAFKKESLNTILPFYTEHDTWHDQWIALVLAALGRLYFMDMPLLNYRIHKHQQLGLPDKPRSNPDFRRAVHETWLRASEHDAEGFKTHHLAWALLASECWFPILYSRVSEKELLIAAHSKIRNQLSKAKTSWLRELPFFRRKIKLLKHWLKGGEYLRISLHDVVKV